jgi:AGZA family xanthine/uracil permease-like MFS transporter
MSSIAANFSGLGRLKGDFNGFLGLFTNILTNLMVMSGIMLAIGMPFDVVFGSVIPGVAIGIAAGNFYWAYFAKRTARRTGNPNVCALPYGPSVGHMFLVVFVVMGPVLWSTRNPLLAWGTALAWCAIEGLVEIVAAFFARKARAGMPRAAMLGNSAGLAITLIAMTPFAQLWTVPYIGIVCLGIAVLGFFGKKKFPLGIPAAVWMVAIGIILGWATGLMTFEALQTQLARVSLRLPHLAISELIMGFGNVGPFLISAIPFGIGNAIGTLNCVESAAAAGDNYPEKEALISDGVLTLIDSAWGGCFPTTVYIGHPGYKEMGAKTSYTIMTGIAVLIVCWGGFVPVLSAIVPLVAILPILIYVALTIGGQAFQATPRNHHPAILVAFIPWLANWVVTIIQNTVQAMGNLIGQEAIREVLGAGPPTANAVGFISRYLLTGLENSSIFYAGLLSLSRGNVMTGATMAMMVVFIIDKKLVKAAIACGIQAALAFFGFVHAAGLGINAAQTETLSYLSLAIVILATHFYNKKFHPEGDDESIVKYAD